MLRLSSIAQRISTLEDEVYQDDSSRMDTWAAMVTWRFFAYEHGASAMKVLNSLSRDHFMQAVRGRLYWFSGRFADVLPHQANDKWWDERVELAFAIVMDEAIELGYSQVRLETPESMNECISVVADLLSNEDVWQSFYAAKKAEAQAHEDRLRYRSAFHTGTIDADGLEWLQQFDSDFWEHNQSAKQPAPVPEKITVPFTSEKFSDLTAPVVQPQNGQAIEVIYVGLDPEGSFTITCDGRDVPVHRGRVYPVSDATWQNVRTDSRWKRIEQRSL